MNHRSIKMKLSIEWSYPTKQLNDDDITEEMQIKFLDLFLVNIGIEQNKMYHYLMRALKNKYPILRNSKKLYQYGFRWSTTNIKYGIPSSRFPRRWRNER